MKVNQGISYRCDTDGVPIPGGSSFPDILNVAVTSGTWTPITLTTRRRLMGCKSILCKMRAGGSWLLSHLAAGTRYFTVSGAPLSIDIAHEKEEILFYVNPTVTGTFEVILLD